VRVFRRVHQIAQRADDLDRAVEFYRDTLGLPLTARFDPPGLAFFSDDAGTFGTAGSEEWMAFFRDSESNLVGLVERRAAH
jgi:methylmalonyl-CoA/ethylmalonyl-CoA epimerase